MAALDAVFADAAVFLEPILSPGKSKTAELEISLEKLLLPRCAPDLKDQTSSGHGRILVALQALRFLTALDMQLRHPDANRQSVDEVFQTPRKRRILNTLVDIVSIEGIHPYLEPGVGLPVMQRLQNAFRGWNIDPRMLQPSTVPWDEAAWAMCKEILRLRTGSMLSLLIDDRILVDLIALVLQAAYSPTTGILEAKRLTSSMLREDRTETIRLLSLVASLIQPNTPQWLRQPLATALAGAPMRERGVHDTINFLASAQQRQPTSDGAEQPVPSTGPLITNVILEQASQVICAVPASIDPETWFKSIGPQLLKMLSSQEVDEQKAGSYIAGSVLSRRNVGSPGTAGWKWLALPILGNITPAERTGLEQVWQHVTEMIGDVAPLPWAVSSLTKLLTLHPNPGLVKRLGSRTFSSLWTVACVSHRTSAIRDVEKNCIRILQGYVKSTSADVVVNLLKRYFLSSETESTFEVHRSGEIRIQIPSEHGRSHDPALDGLRMLKSIDQNMEVLVEIINGFPQDEICRVFTLILDMWVSSRNVNVNNRRLGTDEEDDSTTIIVTKAIQVFLENFRTSLVSNPVRMLPSIHSLLQAYVEAEKSNARQSANFTLTDLANIAAQADDNNSEDEFSMMASLAIGLLSVMSTNRSVTSTSGNNADEVLEPLKQTLKDFISLPCLPAQLLLSAKSVLSELDSASDGTDATQRYGDTTSKKLNNDAEEYRDALANISSSLAPVRAQGMNMLNKLIQDRSPFTTGTDTIAILLALLREDDEYVHLNAVASIALLVKGQPVTVTTQLVDSYVDTDESSSLEVRLRLGEAVQKVVESVGGDLSVFAAVHIAQAMIAVAGRRGQRSKEVERRKREAIQKRRELKRAEREWGGEIPKLPEEYMEEVTPADEMAARIIEKWAGSGKEEDFRIRASALSILATLLSVAFDKLEQSVVEEGMEVCLLTIRHEKDEGAAILRRAALVCLKGLVTGAARARQEGKDGGWPDLLAQIHQVMPTLEEVGGSDSDDLVRGHALQVVEAIKENEAEALEAQLRGEDIRFDLDGKLRGLHVRPDHDRRPNPGIQEIE